METKSFSKKFTYMFAITIFAVLSGFANTIITWFQNQWFSVNILDFLLLAEGIIFWQALKSTSIEKTLNQFDALKPFSFILALYSLYLFVNQIMNLFIWGATIESIAFAFSTFLSRFSSSLNIFFVSILLKKKNIKKMNKSFFYLLLLEITLIAGSLGCLVFLSDTIADIIISILLFIFALVFLPALLANKVLKGALIGYIIAGDTGAVIGAIAAKEKGKK